MIINVLETSMVRPAAETPSHTLWLSNADLVVVNIHTRTVYFYRHHPTAAAVVVDPAALRMALSRVLVPFYPLSGRLKRNKVDGRTEIDCNGEGVLFVVAETATTLDDLGDFAPSTELLKLTPAIDCSADISSFPLTVLQVTLFKCGGVAVGVGIHHRVGDGPACLHFVNTWSKFASSTIKGYDHDHLVKVKPFLDRTLMRARDPPRPRFQHTEYHQPSPPEPTNGLLQPEPVVLSTFKLTLEQVNILKARLKGCTTETEVKFSTFEAVASHVWRCARTELVKNIRGQLSPSTFKCVCLARGVKVDQETKLYIAVDGRPRLSNPPLPQGYFGNAVFTAVPTVMAGDLLSKPIKYGVSKMREALERMDNDYMRSAIDHLELLPNISAAARSSDSYKSPNLGVTSWVRLPIHEADFGWGPPIYMGPAYIAYEGLAYLLPTQMPEILSLAISLKAQHMKLFEKLFYNMIS